MSSNFSVSNLTTHVLALLSPSPTPASEAVHVMPQVSPPKGETPLYRDPEAGLPSCAACLRRVGLDTAGLRTATGQCWSCADTRTATITSYENDPQKLVHDMENRLLVLMDAHPSPALLRLLGAIHYAYRRNLPAIVAETAVLIDQMEMEVGHA